MLRILEAVDNFLNSVINSFVEFANFSQLVKCILVLSHCYLLQLLPYTPFLPCILHPSTSFQNSTSFKQLVFP